MTREQKDNLFALLFFIGFAVSFVFNHVNELLWWCGVVAMVIGVFVTFSLRMLSTIFKWNLPKAIE